MQENSEKTFVSTSTTKAIVPEIIPIGIISKTFIFLFGFLLPFIALTVELTTRMCAGTLFDPLPTIWHAVLIGFVPFSAILSLKISKKNKVEIINKVLFFNGIALSVSIFYTIIFIPIIPIGIIAILFLGIGFLPLSPLMSMLASFKTARYFLRQKNIKSTNLIFGVITGIILLIILELPVTLTRYAMELASSTDRKTELKGIKLLRQFGNKNVMLRYCYVMRGQAPDLISVLLESHSTMNPNIARDIYYKVTGRTFNSVPPPDALKSKFQTSDEFLFDSEQGGDIVGGKLKNLSLNNSLINSIIDQNSGTAYTEWTMVFRNKSNWTQEARTQIKIPENGVVSRVTLWINGQEREAAFAGKEKVKTAYKKVVERRRDPLLVTSDGADRILVQCFPVPVNGEMKIKIGITYPLQFNNKKQAIMPIPYIIERNFNIDENFKHSLWVDSKKPIVTTGKQFDLEKSNNIYTLQAKIDNQDLENGYFSLKLNTDINNSWSEDLDKNYIISQKVVEKSIVKPERVVFLIDGSYSMRNQTEKVVHSLKKIEKKFDTKIVVASDEITELKNADDLSKIIFEGGHDNTEAIYKAVKLACQKNNSTIIWLHGPQSDYQYNMSSSLYGLTRYKADKTKHIQFYEKQIGDGDNILIKELNSIFNLYQLPSADSLENNLNELFNKYNNPTEISFIREKVLKDKFNSKNINKSSLHQTRLWAYSEILKDIDNFKNEKAVEIAGKYHLVSPVSGAIVLENQQQYDESELKPATKSSVPIIPEPEEWLLIIVSFGLMVFVTFRRKKLCYQA